MILLIDNYDSFTYNLYQQISYLGGQVSVHQNDAITIEQIEELNPNKIVISPGPKDPTQAGISNDIVQNFYTTIPILGVCLGHQCIGAVFGTRIVQAKHILHGKTSTIKHNKKGLFKDIEQGIEVARYHSLCLESLPQDFELTAWTDKGEIMGIEHKNYPTFGIQFHPESFMTPNGNQIISNFLNV